MTMNKPYENNGCAGDVLTLVSPIPPSVNHYMGIRTIQSHGRYMATNYKKKESKQYQDEFMDYVAAEVAKQGWKYDPEGKRHIYVDAHFIFPRTDMDSNNYWKCMLDAITETQLVWADDNIVCERTQMITYDSQNPHVVLEIKRVGYIGVFENDQEHECFKNRCANCRRGSGNCSIYKKATEGKEQECVSRENGTPICKKYKEKKDNGRGKKSND